MSCEKPGKKRTPVHSNPFKPRQITGWIEVAGSDDGTEMPPDLPDGTKLLKEKPTSIKTTLDTSFYGNYNAGIVSEKLEEKEE